MKIEILAYRLNKSFCTFGIHYNRIMKTLEISLYFWNIIIMFGKEENINKYMYGEEKNER